ncbi:hypothetical protein DFH27DRAFT_643833 [Peziza echinospora]|nr:hypothetical protein DFH27DRAFT_643833 [Peziza echinospora]
MSTGTSRNGNWRIGPPRATEISNLGLISKKSGVVRSGRMDELASRLARDDEDLENAWPALQKRFVVSTCKPIHPPAPARDIIARPPTPAQGKYCLTFCHTHQAPPPSPPPPPPPHPLPHPRRTPAHIQTLAPPHPLHSPPKLTLPYRTTDPGKGYRTHNSAPEETCVKGSPSPTASAPCAGHCSRHPQARASLTPQPQQAALAFATTGNVESKLINRLQHAIPTHAIHTHQHTDNPRTLLRTEVTATALRASLWRCKPASQQASRTTAHESGSKPASSEPDEKAATVAYLPQAFSSNTARPRPRRAGGGAARELRTELPNIHHHHTPTHRDPTSAKHHSLHQLPPRSHLDSCQLPPSASTKTKREPSFSPTSASKDIIPSRISTEQYPQYLRHAGTHGSSIAQRRQYGTAVGFGEQNSGEEEIMDESGEVLLSTSQAT